MIRILHLEDNEYDADLIHAALRVELTDCHVSWVTSRQAYEDGLANGDLHVILADYSLPSIKGDEALQLAILKRPDLPFIFVAGTMAEETGVETLKSGAADFVLKHRLARLPKAVLRAIGEFATAKAQREAAQEIKASLREKELLLQEVHHRVNNNLQVICALISMQSGRATNEQVARALRENLERVMAMARVHSMLYASRNLREIDFADYVRRQVHDLAVSYKVDLARVKFLFELSPVRLGIDRAICCGLILNEIASNAFKHAFPGGRSGEVKFSLANDESGISLAVADTGVGFPASLRQGKTKSVGLTVIDVLTKQLNGTVDIVSGGGTRASVSFV